MQVINAIICYNFELEGRTRLVCGVVILLCAVGALVVNFEHGARLDNEKGE